MRQERKTNPQHQITIVADYQEQVKKSYNLIIRGVNYTEDRIKDRILNKDKELGNIIDIRNNEKAKSNKGYEHWVTKDNLKTATSTLIEIRDKGFNSMEELERGMSRIPIEKNELKREFDKLSWEQKKD